MKDEKKTKAALIHELKELREKCYSNNSTSRYSNLESIVSEQTNELQEATKKFRKEINTRQAAEAKIGRNEERLESLLELNEKKYSNEGEIIKASLEKSVKLTSSDVGYMHFFDENEQLINLNIWSANTIRQCQANEETHYPIHLAGIWADAIRTRKAAIQNDYNSGPMRKGMPDGHIPINSHMSIPVFDGDTIVAIVGVGNKQTDYTKSDARQLMLFAKSMWLVVKNFRIEKRLADESMLFKQIMDNNPDQIYFKDTENRFTIFNEALAKRMEDRGITEIIGKTDLDIFGKKLGQKFIDEEKTIFKTGISEDEIVAKETWKDGTVTWVVSTKAPVFDQDGKVTGLLGITRDVTKRVVTEEALKESKEALRSEKELLRKLINTIPDNIFIKDQDGKLILNNAAHRSFLGYETEAEGIGKSDFDFFEEDAAKIYFEDEQKVLNSSTPLINRVEEAINNRGDVKWFQTSKLIQTYGKSDQKILIGINHDITAKRQAEEILHKSENRFRSIIQDLSDIVLIMDQNAKVSFATPSCERIFGYSINEFILMSSTLDIIHPDDKQKVRQSISGVIENTSDYSPLEVRCKHKDGHHIYVEFVGTNMLENEGVNGLVITGREITERKKAESMLKASLEELGSSNKDLEQFAYAVSHDLQEPLRKVKSFGELLEEKYESIIDEKGSNYIRYMVDGADRMQILITNLLDYSRISTRGKALVAQDSGVLVKEALSNLEIALKESMSVVRVEDLPQVMADGPQIVRLIQNLVSNSIKFKSEENPAITISATKEKDFWKFKLSDNGIGIDKKYYEKIFQIFQRLHSRQACPGTGIGLALCRRIIERHGGKLWVYSTPGKGSDFYFTLPSA